MQKYELLILAVPAITQDETKQLESEVEKGVKAADGVVISFDKWGKYRLAYPVRKNDYGVYFLIRFESNKEKSLELIQKLNALFSVKLEPVVMRHIFSVLDATKPIEYTRPQSLEEVPDKENNELSKGKIEKILSKTESKRKVLKKETQTENPKVAEER